MIFTSNYKEFKTTGFKTYSISGDRGESVGYEGKCYPRLAPKKEFWKIWHRNIGRTDEISNNKYYIRQFYMHVLKNLDPKETYEKLDSSILLCFEEPEQFCHRHIVAAWFELYLGIEVPELDRDLKVKKRPEYIKEYLEEVIKEKIDMKGFSTIRSYYLIEQAELLESKLEKVELISYEKEEIEKEISRLKLEALVIESNKNLQKRKENKHV